MAQQARGHLSLRIARATLERLERRARHAAQPRSALAERYVFEGLQMDEHPGIRFVDGALGRRPAVAGTGLDVWEIVETVRVNGDSIEEAAAYLEVDPSVVRVAVGYYGSNREEIDAFVERVHDIAEHEEAKWRRAREALA
jgi:uncharacterized protein (DUF433 family)